MKLSTILMELKKANDFVLKHHRHHASVYRYKFRIGASINDELVGVIHVGRPVSCNLDDGKTVEITRLCTNGARNCCSFLLAAASKISKIMGYSKIITYILETESGCSLTSAGFQKECDTKEGEWGCKSRPRNTTSPTCKKQRFAKYLTNEYKQLKTNDL